MATTPNAFVRHSLSIGKILALLVVTALMGCDKEKAAPLPAQPQQTTQAAPTPAPVAAAQKPASESAGIFRGRVTREDGKPITTPKAKISVEIAGVATQSGQRVRYAPKVQEDGTFQIPLTDGIYHRPSATVSVIYNDKQYQMQLARDPDEQDDRESKDGIVQNFIWKMTGPNRQAPDPANHTHWHGGTVSLLFRLYRHDLDKKMPPAPTGTKLVATLTPTAPLIDGSEGKVLTIERIYNRESDSLDNPNLSGIPLGLYTLTLHEAWPDGTQRPVLLRQPSGQYTPSQPITFDPDRLGTPKIAYISAVPAEK